jgi:integrase
MASKRAYGTGRIFVKHGAWYGSWRTPHGRRTTRKLGPVKASGKRDGLSKTQAEAALREMILTEAQRPAGHADDLTVSQLGRLLLSGLEADGRKPSHIETVQYHLSAHIDPLLGDLPAGQVLESDVRRLVDKMLRAGKAPKTIRNVAGTLHSVLGQVLKDNPCDMAALPQAQAEPAIRFLTQDELGRVLNAPPPPDAPKAERDWWPVIRLLVLTAAMTGMRLGELRALTWADLDMAAMKVRVRHSFVRGQMGAPKSRRSVRAIPLASRLVSELEDHHRTTVWDQDTDLVLAHPHTGRPLDRVRLLTHFKAALKRADVRPVRIHDLRHTFATTVAASGHVSMRTLQEWLGHLDARTTAIYADYMPGAREQEMLDAAFMAADSNWTPISLSERHADRA